MPRIFAVLGLLLALCGAGVRPAEAYPAQRAAVLSGSPCTGRTVSLDLVANSGVGVYCLNGTRYSSPTFIPGWSFTRASTETCQWADGHLTTAPAGVPCMTDLGLGIWESRTNLALQSQSFGATPWALTGATVSADATAAPDLTVTADKLVESSGGTFHFDQQDNAVTANTAYSIGLFVKPAGRNFLKIQASNTAANSGVAVEINLTTGALSNSTFGTGTIASSKVVAVANGFWWLQLNGVVIDATSTTLRQQLLMGSASGTYSYSGDGASGVYLWQDDAQAGAVLTSPIPTTSSAVTRAADVPIETSAGIATLAQGTMVASWKQTAQKAQASGLIALAAGDATLNRVQAFLNSSGKIGWRYSSGGSDIIFTDGATTIGAGTHKIAVSWGPSGFIGYVDGVQDISSALAPGSSSLDTVLTGITLGIHAPLNDNFGKLVTYGTQWTAAQLQALTQ